MAGALNPETTVTTIKRFLSGKLMGTAANGYVVGLSGGIDSALSATLAVTAVGSDKVLGVLMPYRTSSAASREDAQLLVQKLAIEHRVIDISPMIDAYYDKIDSSNALRAGNKMARERMTILFDLAHENNLLVLGTSNRTETCLGYTTWFGDSACSLNPIGELYKSDVRALATHLEVPQPIIDKAPSADLWQNQTDEAEIGVTYVVIDGILRKIIDEGVRSLEELERSGFMATDVSRVVSLMNRNAFKRHLPEVAPFGRTVIPDDVMLQE